jgi:cell division protein FtsW
MPVLVQVVIWLRAWNRKYFGLFGKTFGAYLYRFLIIYGVHRVPYHFRAISKVALPVVWICCCIHWLKELLLQAQMPVGGFRCLLYVIPDVDIGICSTIYIWPYLSKTREVAINFKSSLWELWLPVFILVLILPANFRH